MFYFFSTSQTPSNQRHHKGLLFEDLLRRFLDIAGYSCVLHRTKFNSLEYDVIGEHRVDRRKVVGEAKAHDDTITSEVVSSFIGKFTPHHYRHRGNISGLFLSTSPLSPDAEDYLRNLKEEAPFNVERHSGSDLERQIRTALRLPDDQEVANVLAALELRVQATHLLHTDYGSYVIAVASVVQGAFPDRFALVSDSGKLISDSQLLGRLRENIPALQELDPVLPQAVTMAMVHIGRMDVPGGLITASDWLDFRHPAGPEFFIGRRDALGRADEMIALLGSGAILEIKSRSGVGKSSLLVALSERWRSQGHVVELHDARDVHSAVDVLRLVGRFAQSANNIREFEEIASTLGKFSEQLRGRRGIFIVDQFEATFQAPEVFRAYEYLAMCIARGPANVAMVFARKDDLLTTHDDLQIDIDRLRNLAQPIVLDDFSRAEAFELLGRISEAFPNKMNPQILSQVLEFAQGFPWLLKRTMAHVAKTIRQKVSQQELLSSGLHLVDLFEEELSELDEIERGYLTRVAGTLPATYHALMHRYEGDPQLPRMLEKLTSRRILRFSAGTYDTYNDVFKDFLLYDRLPERSQSALFKLGPGPVMKAFRSLRGKNSIDVSALGQSLGKSQGGTYNTLRELRLAGLVSRDPDGWIVPQVVRDYEHQNRLGEYVRQSLLRNGAVSTFLVELEKAGEISFSDVKSFLREHFPFTQARDGVWDSYARTFIAWLQELGFVEADESSNVKTRSHAEVEKVVDTLGNLHLSGRGSRPRKGFFLPSKEISVLLKVLDKISRGDVRADVLSRSERAALYDLGRLQAAEFDGNGLARALVTPERLRELIAQMMGSVPYTEFWSAVASGCGFVDAVTQVFGLENLAESTRQTLAEKLVSWGKHVGHLPKQRLPHAGSRTDSIRLFV